jgi:hypothetical protein
MEGMSQNADLIPVDSIPEIMLTMPVSFFFELRVEKEK